MDVEEIKRKALEDIYTYCDDKEITGAEYISKWGLNGIQETLWGWLPTENLDILNVLVDMPYLLDFKPDEYKGTDFAQRILNALCIELSNKLVSPIKQYTNL